MRSPLLAMAFLAATLGATSHLKAASGTWGAPGGGLYWTTTNWLSGNVPNGDGDVATFTSAGGGTVEINGGVTVKELVFDAGASAYTISPSAGFSLYLASDATVEATGTGANAQLITADIFRKGPSTFRNDYVSGDHTLTFSGDIFGNVNTGVGLYNLLTLSGSNSGANTISGNIGGGVGVTAVTKTGAGTWVLSGDNVYQGPTNINGGMLMVSGTHQAGTGGYTLDGGALGGAGGVIAASGVTLAGTAGSAINVSGAGLGTVGSQAALTAPGLLEFDLGSSALDISQAGAGALQFVLTTPEASDSIRLNSGTLEIGEGVLSLSNFTFDVSNWSGEGAEGTYFLLSTASSEAIVGSLADHDLSTILGGYQLTLSLGSDNSNFDTLELNVAAIPEPTVLSAFFVGTALLLGQRWRRRR